MILKWLRISFLYFILVAVLGVFLRYLLIAPIDGINFRYFLHAHSHLAILGWIFNALFIALLLAYVPEKIKKYKLLFWLLQMAVVGMLISFPIQGYAAVSISFSTLHIFLSWWFAVKFFKDIKGKEDFSLKFIRAALVFMVISAIGPFGLGATMAQGMGGSPLYNLSIYFYLHFQYNGWFIFAIFGLFFWFLENNNISYNKKKGRGFYYLMLLSCVLGYALSALWLQPTFWVYSLGFVAASLQLYACYFIWQIFKESSPYLKNLFSKQVMLLMQIAFISFLIKIALQFISAFPYFADLAYRVRNFTIGYLHIVFLGIIAVFLLAWFQQIKFFQFNIRGIQGIWIFLFGFVLSEIIVFLQPSTLLMGLGLLPYSNEVLFIVSLLMPVGLLIAYLNSNMHLTQFSK